MPLTIALGITDAELRMHADMKGMLMEVHELTTEKLVIRGTIQDMKDSWREKEDLTMSTMQEMMTTMKKTVTEMENMKNEVTTMKETMQTMKDSWRRQRYLWRRRRQSLRRR